MLVAQFVEVYFKYIHARSVVSELRFVATVVLTAV